MYLFIYLFIYVVSYKKTDGTGLNLEHLLLLRELPDDCFTRGMKLRVAINVQALIHFHQSTCILL